MRLKNEKGFSFIELITVLLIIGIMAAIAVPSFISWLPNMRLKAAARDVYSAMQKAKMGAVKTNTTVTFTFTAGTGTPCKGGSYTFTNGSSVNITDSMTNDICLSTPSSFPPGFLSTGLLSSGATGGTVKFSHPDSSRVYIVTVTSAGGIRMQ